LEKENGGVYFKTHKMNKKEMFWYEEKEMFWYEEGYKDALLNVFKIIDDCSIGLDIDKSLTQSAKFIRDKILGTLITKEEKFKMNKRILKKIGVKK